MMFHRKHPHHQLSQSRNHRLLDCRGAVQGEEPSDMSTTRLHPCLNQLPRLGPLFSTCNFPVQLTASETETKGDRRSPSEGKRVPRRIGNVCGRGGRGEQGADFCAETEWGGDSTETAAGGQVLSCPVLLHPPHTLWRDDFRGRMVWFDEKDQTYVSWQNQLGWADFYRRISFVLWII